MFLCLSGRLGVVCQVTVLWCTVCGVLIGVLTDLFSFNNLLFMFSLCRMLRSFSNSPCKLFNPPLAAPFCKSCKWLANRLAILFMFWATARIYELLIHHPSLLLKVLKSLNRVK